MVYDIFIYNFLTKCSLFPYLCYLISFTYSQFHFKLLSLYLERVARNSSANKLEALY